MLVWEVQVSWAFRLISYKHQVLSNLIFNERVCHPLCVWVGGTITSKQVLIPSFVFLFFLLIPAWNSTCLVKWIYLSYVAWKDIAYKPACIRLCEVIKDCSYLGIFNQNISLRHIHIHEPTRMPLFFSLFSLPSSFPPIFSFPSSFPFRGK